MVSASVEASASSPCGPSTRTVKRGSPVPESIGLPSGGTAGTGGPWLRGLAGRRIGATTRWGAAPRRPPAWVLAAGSWADWSGEVWAWYDMARSALVRHGGRLATRDCRGKIVPAARLAAVAA